MQSLLTGFCQLLPLSPLDHSDIHEVTQTVPSPEESLGESQSRNTTSRMRLEGRRLVREHCGRITSSF